MDPTQPIMPLPQGIIDNTFATSSQPQDIPLVADYASFAYTDILGGGSAPELELAFGDQKDLAFASSFLRGVSLDDGRPSTQELQLGLSRTKSLTDEDKDSAKERRRTQNRFAQRAYRQRKEQAIKDQEREIESLKHQLAKEKKLNQALAKVIEFLKERLNSKQTLNDAITAAASPTAAKPENAVKG